MSICLIILLVLFFEFYSVSADSVLSVVKCKSIRLQLLKKIFIVLILNIFPFKLYAGNPQQDLNQFFYDNTFAYDPDSKDYHHLKNKAETLPPAERILIQGAFNVNTTDADAWEKLFNERLHFIDFNKRTLAEYVARLVDLNRPFLSLSHFVNGSFDGVGRGILQQALNDMGVNDPSKPQLGPGNITQADLLKDLEAVLVTRDDTFIVRSYGDVVNPKTGVIEARAWCEAVVQRMPEMYDESRGELGRRFEVVSLTWGR